MTAITTQIMFLEKPYFHVITCLVTENVENAKGNFHVEKSLSATGIFITWVCKDHRGRLGFDISQL